MRELVVKYICHNKIINVSQSIKAKHHRRANDFSIYYKTKKDQNSLLINCKHLIGR